MNAVVKPSPSFLRFRDSHHAIAQMFAAGWTISKVSHETGMSRRRLHILLSDPSFRDLVHEYNSNHKDALEEHRDVFEGYWRGAMLLAAAEAYERVSENADEMPMRELLAMIKDGADRFGYSAKTVRVNIDASFASRLDRAIEASDKAKIVEHQPSALPLASPKDPPVAAVADAHPDEMRGPNSNSKPAAKVTSSPARALTNGFPKPVPSFIKILRRQASA